ncbi:ferrous iron transport protein A [bacterium]|nr:ferrous iron transport protein A [bacterium]MBU1883522.1 ferrous iron transport protein A [bacterium]
MNLLECNKNDILEVVKLNTQGALKQRLLSFGVIKGATISFLGYSPTKSTVEIKVGKMNIALRKEEAQTIEVKTK